MTRLRVTVIGSGVAKVGMAKPSLVRSGGWMSAD
jgi:hypothetical protein